MALVATLLQIHVHVVITQISVLALTSRRQLSFEVPVLSFLPSFFHLPSTSFPLLLPLSSSFHECAEAPPLEVLRRRGVRGREGEKGRGGEREGQRGRGVEGRGGKGSGGDDGRCGGMGGEGRGGEGGIEVRGG